MTDLSIQNKLFIDGKFVNAADGATIEDLNPHDNSKIADVALAGKEDVDRAVAAAKKAFPKWSKMAAMDRGRLLLKLADKIEEKAAELAQLRASTPVIRSRIPPGSTCRVPRLLFAISAVWRTNSKAA